MPRTVAIGVFASIAAVAVASIGGVGSAWGINHLSYFPVPVAVVLVVLMGVTLLPRIREPAGRWLSENLETVLDTGRPGTLVQLAPAFGFVVLCFVFRSATQLWGDSELMASIAEQAAAGGRSLAGAVGFAVLNDPLAPGVAALHAVVAKLGVWAGVSARSALASFYAVLGGVWVLVTIRYLRRSALPAPTRVLLGVLLYTSGSIVLFFGYIEDYGLLFLASSLVALYGLGVRRGRASLLVPAAVALVAIGLNVLSALLLPALVYLVLTPSSADGRRAARTA